MALKLGSRDVASLKLGARDLAGAMLGSDLATAECFPAAGSFLREY